MANPKLPKLTPEQIEELKRLAKAAEEAAPGKGPQASPEHLAQLKRIEAGDKSALPKRRPIPPIHRFYRFTATALGASMWFFVSYLPVTEFVELRIFN